MTIDVLKTLPNGSKCNSNMPSAPIRRTGSSVRRSLFGDVDHEKSMSFLKKELDAIAESQKKRWNFDFTNERPLHDDSCEYEWTPLQPDEIIPKPYALSRLPYLYEHTENTPTSDKSSSCLPTSQQSTRLQEVTMSKTKLKQTLIDGYIKSRKRTSSCTVISTKEPCSCSCDKTLSNSSDSQQCNYHLDPPSKKQCLTPSKNPPPSSLQN